MELSDYLDLPQAPPIPDETLWGEPSAERNAELCGLCGLRCWLWFDGRCHSQGCIFDGLEGGDS